MEKWLRIFAKQLNLKKIKNGQFSFLWHFATTTHCKFKFWKIDPPYCSCSTMKKSGFQLSICLSLNFLKKHVLFPASSPLQYVKSCTVVAPLLKANKLQSSSGVRYTHRIVDDRIEKSIKGRRIGHWAFAASIFKVQRLRQY